MKPLPRRILSITALVLVLYVGGCAAYVAAFPGDFKGDFVDALASLLLGGIPLLFIGWLVCVQVGTYKFFPRNQAVELADEDSSGEGLFERQEYGVNGLPLTNGYDALGNFQGIDMGSSNASSSTD